VFSVLDREVILFVLLKWKIIHISLPIFILKPCLRVALPVLLLNMTTYPCLETARIAVLPVIGAARRNYDARACCLGGTPAESI